MRVRVSTSTRLYFASFSEKGSEKWLEGNSQGEVVFFTTIKAFCRFYGVEQKRYMKWRTRWILDKKKDKRLHLRDARIMYIG